MRLTLTSPSLIKQKDIDKAAALLSIDFPAEYAAFLVEHNGGIPQPNVLPRKGGDITIDWFYSLHRRITAETAIRDLVSITQTFRTELNLPESVLPIALVNGQDILILTVQSKSAGRVSLWSMIESGYERRHVSKIADSFGQLIERLSRPAASQKADRRQLLSDLETAITDGDIEAIRELAPAVDLKKKAPAGFVHPVHWAILGGNPKVLAALHETGIDFTAEYEGITPQQLARQTLRDEKSQVAMCTKHGLKQDAKRHEKRVRSLEKTLTFLKKIGIQ